MPFVAAVEMGAETSTKVRMLPVGLSVVVLAAMIAMRKLDVEPIPVGM